MKSERADGSGPLRVLLAFDSFKGSISAAQACREAAEGLRGRFGDRVRAVEVPLADGGEGSLELLRAAIGLNAITVSTRDAIGRPIDAEYLFDETNRAAYIEVARVAGLPQVSDVPLRPLEASSAGVGDLVVDALGRGAEHLNIFLGGSATTDAGSGLLRALGAELLDEAGRPIPPGGAGLARLHRVAVNDSFERAGEVRWTFITDIAAPLLGSTGAAYGYAPQKGANPGEVRQLEVALGHAAEVLSRASGRELGGRPGFGAAGGMALFPAAFFPVEIVAGGRFLAEKLGAAAALREADLVVTGEGRFDEQSLDGKVVGTLADLAAEQEPPVPVVVVAGSVSLDAERYGEVSAAFAVAQGPATLEELCEDTGRKLAGRVADIVSVYLAGRLSR